MDDKPQHYQTMRRNALSQARMERAALRAANAKLDLLAELCRRVSLGQSLYEVCREDRHMPAYDVVLRWLSEDREFAEQYRRAQHNRADTLFDETLVIADDARNDWMAKYDRDGSFAGYQLNGEAVARSKMRIDTRFKIASKLNAAKYGDKLAVEGNPDKPLVVSVTHRIVQVVQQEGGPIIEAEPVEDKWKEPEGE